jgi:hypothetical protein
MSRRKKSGLDMAAIMAHYTSAAAPVAVAAPVVVSNDYRLISPRVAERLMSMGVMRFRQSWFGLLRDCPSKLRYEIHTTITNDQAATSSMFAVLGTVYHAAAETGMFSNQPSEWERLIVDAVRKQSNPRRVNFGNRFLTREDVPRFAEIMCSSKSPIGLPIGDLVRKTEEAVQTMMPISRREFNLSHIENGIELTSIVDAEGMIGTNRAIVDYKSSGLWGCVIDAALGETSSPKGESWDIRQVSYSPQHLFYRMLGDLSGDPIGESTIFAAVFPVMATPVKKGARAGEDRGSIVVVSPTPGASSKAFIEDHKNLMDMHFGGESITLPRAYPTTYGKPACPACRYHAPCQRDGLGHSRETMSVDYD